MKALVGINQIVPFQMTVDQFFDWARTIDRLVPGLDPMAVAFVVDQFMIETLEYDKSKGIQNVFAGLKKIERTENGYRIKPTQKYTW